VTNPLGVGTAYLARVVGEKRAREIWMLCRRYDAPTAEHWVLVNRVVPAAEVRRWAGEMLALADGVALRQAVSNIDSEHIAGCSQLGFSGLNQFIASEEAREGVEAFAAKRAPDFAPYRAAAST
jgi:2-ketocyclohexanecarboxyl-CoA hydrolase